MFKFLDRKLAPGVSLGLALGTGAIIYATYAHFLPSVVDHRAAQADNGDAQAAERLAAWTSAGILAAISILSGDEVVFMVGATEIIALSWIHRHADMVNPGLGKATVSAAVASTANQSDQATGGAYMNAISDGAY